MIKSAILLGLSALLIFLTGSRVSAIDSEFLVLST
jgi:hypothetical protein